MNQGKECPRCDLRVLAFMENVDGVFCHPCGHRLSEAEYLILKLAFQTGKCSSGDDERFDFGGDWWKG